eukprot:TRINITY_DN135846_c0_g1_i1.p1 TRINITY_DN135846_c0_g1~~TRINITY_DN135846_c0_g1_i1.p1  ORF type:complete len:699 (+),score=185.21 TRINITY_DN135846_c0_g1_i1:561-2657(+)
MSLEVKTQLASAKEALLYLQKKIEGELAVKLMGKESMIEEFASHIKESSTAFRELFEKIAQVHKWKEVFEGFYVKSMDDIKRQLSDTIVRTELAKYNEEQTEAFDLKLDAHRNEVKDLGQRVYELTSLKQKVEDAMTAMNGNRRRVDTLEADIRAEIKSEIQRAMNENEVKMQSLRKRIEGVAETADYSGKVQASIEEFTEGANARIERTESEIIGLKSQCEKLAMQNSELSAELSRALSTIKELMDKANTEDRENLQAEFLENINDLKAVANATVDRENAIEKRIGEIEEQIEGINRPAVIQSDDLSANIAALDVKIEAVQRKVREMERVKEKQGDEQYGKIMEDISRIKADINALKEERREIKEENDIIQEKAAKPQEHAPAKVEAKTSASKMFEIDEEDNKNVVEQSPLQENEEEQDIEIELPGDDNEEPEENRPQKEEAEIPNFNNEQEVQEGADQHFVAETPEKEGEMQEQKEIAVPDQNVNEDAKAQEEEIVENLSEAMLEEIPDVQIEDVPDAPVEESPAKPEPKYDSPPQDKSLENEQENEGGLDFIEGLPDADDVQPADPQDNPAKSAEFKPEFEVEQESPEPQEQEKSNEGMDDYLNDDILDLMEQDDSKANKGQKEPKPEMKSSVKMSELLKRPTVNPREMPESNSPVEDPFHVKNEGDDKEKEDGQQTNDKAGRIENEFEDEWFAQ